MEAIGAYGQGLIDLEELHRAECHGLPGSRRLTFRTKIEKLERWKISVCFVQFLFKTGEVIDIDIEL